MRNDRVISNGTSINYFILRYLYIAQKVDLDFQKYFDCSIKRLSNEEVEENSSTCYLY